MSNYGQFYRLYVNYSDRKVAPRIGETCLLLKNYSDGKPSKLYLILLMFLFCYSNAIIVYLDMPFEQKFIAAAESFINHLKTLLEESGNQLVSSNDVSVN